MEQLLQAVREQARKIEEEAGSMEVEDPHYAAGLHRIARELKALTSGWEKQVVSKDEVGEMPKELLS